MYSKLMKWVKVFLRKTPGVKNLFGYVDNRLYQRYLPLYQSMFPPTVAQASVPVESVAVDTLPVDTAPVDNGQVIEEQPAENMALSEAEKEIIEEQPAESVVLSDADKEIINNLYLKFAPPGHYYSPIPSLEELQAEQDRIFSTEYRPLPGVECTESQMLKYLERFSPYYAEFPFTEQKTAGLRFYMDNGVYAWGEAVILYSLMRYLRPRRIIEVGSGFSSALMMDVNERFLDNSVELTFIDPYPQRLMELLSPDDLQQITLIPQRLQDIDLDLFRSLETNDIAFFDSTHVSKCNSDVNHIIFDVLPHLNPGVFIHFHDVFYPFEYPQRWLLDVGAAWNEDYLLRAFLQYNGAFHIEFFNDYLDRFCKPAVNEAFKEVKWLGSSLWLQRNLPAEA